MSLGMVLVYRFDGHRDKEASIMELALALFTTAITIGAVMMLVPPAQVFILAGVLMFNQTLMLEKNHESANKEKPMTQHTPGGRGMRAFKAKGTQYDEYLIVIAGDAWRITGDDKMVAEWKYVGEFTGPLMYDAVQIDPDSVPISVRETTLLIAMDMYAADWHGFATPAIAKARPAGGS